MIGTLTMVMSTLLIALWVYAARDMRKQPNMSPTISDAACILPVTRGEIDEQNPTQSNADFDEENNSDIDQHGHTPEDIVKIAATNCG